MHLVAEGRPIKAIAVAQGTTPSAAADAVEKLFLRMAADASSGGQNSLRRLRSLYEAIVNREEQGESLSRLLPSGVAEMMREQGVHAGETKELVVSVLMSDIRGYTTIAEKADPSVLARQLNVHRAEMNKSIVAAAGTVMQFVGDAVMAVFGAPVAFGGPRREGRGGSPRHACRPTQGERALARRRASLSSSSGSG